MCQKGRIQQPDSNKIAEFVSKYVEAKKLNLHAVVSCVCKIPEPRMKNSENGVSSYCNKCAKSYSQK